MLSRKFTKNEKRLLAVFAFILLACVYKLAVFDVTQASIDNAQAAYEDTENQYTTQLILAAQIKKMENELASIVENPDAPKAEIPKYDNLVNLTAMLNDIFHDREGCSFTFTQDYSNATYVRRNVSISFQANSYSDAKQIIVKLYNSKYSCKLGNISLSSSNRDIESGVINVTLDVTFIEGLE